MWKARESYFQQEFMVKGLVQGKELAIQNVHTPFSLCEEIIRKLTEFTGFLENKKILVYNIEFLDILYRMGILWNNEVWFVNENNNKVQFAKDIYRGDEDDKFIVRNWLEWNTNMKFDVIVGNPPYQTKGKIGNRTRAIWPEFVEKSFGMLKEYGYLCLVHPSGWRDVNGIFENTKNTILSKDIKYLECHSFDDGMRIFGVGTSYDWYIIQNKLARGNKTEIIGQDGVKYLIDVSNMDFIPNGMISDIKKLIAVENEEKNEIISNSSYHTQRDFISENKTETFKYPCVYTITKSDGITFRYSKINNKGHFGIPKVIWSNGLGTYPIIDLNGEYGLTEFSYAIVDKPEKLLLIQKAMEHRKFIEIMKWCKFTNNRYNRKVIALFRKDFWKQFVDENGNELK